MPAKYLIYHEVKCECTEHPLAQRCPVSSQELACTALPLRGTRVFPRAWRTEGNHQGSIRSRMLPTHLVLIAVSGNTHFRQRICVFRLVWIILLTKKPTIQNPSWQFQFRFQPYFCQHFMRKPIGNRVFLQY